MSEDLINKAIEYAKIANSPLELQFLDHADRIIILLKSIGIQNDSIFATVYLHNIISKKVISYEELVKEFSEDIANMLLNLDYISKFKIPTNSAKTLDLHKLFIHLAKDYRVLLIRLADRVDNISHCYTLDTEKQNLIAQKALNVYAPISQAAGIYAFTKILQDQSLKILNPVEYELIDGISKEKFESIQGELDVLKSQISEFLENENIKHQISYRIKSHYSIYNKSKTSYGRIGYETVSKLNDLAGIRVLVEEEDHCYVVLAYLQQIYKMIETEYDDYITNPKPNGYQTLQTAFHLSNDVTCEIQVRTFDMHERNEFGSASHFSYKYASSKSLDAKWIKNLIELKQKALLAVDNKLPIGLFSDMIFVFTPKHDLITLSNGSSIIDFAYAIHTDLGNHLAAAKVNGKIEKITTLLKSGDTIEIITSKAAAPKPDWLRFAKTPEARKHIKASQK